MYKLYGGFTSNFFDSCYGIWILDMLKLRIVQTFIRRGNHISFPTDCYFYLFIQCVIACSIVGYRL